MVTDHEMAFRNAVSNTFPNVMLLRCWNHLFKNIGDWISRHSGKALDQQFYAKEVRALLSCDSKEKYESNNNEKINSRN